MSSPSCFQHQICSHQNCYPQFIFIIKFIHSQCFSYPPTSCWLIFQPQSLITIWLFTAYSVVRKSSIWHPKHLLLYWNSYVLLTFYNKNPTTAQFIKVRLLLACRSTISSHIAMFSWHKLLISFSWVARIEVQWFGIRLAPRQRIMKAGSLIFYQLNLTQYLSWWKSEWRNFVEFVGGLH